MATNLPIGSGDLVDVDYLNEVMRHHWRKTSPKTVNAAHTATDLLNGEVTINGGAMAADRLLSLDAWGDWKQNSGALAAPPRFVLKLGGTTLLDTSTLGAHILNLAQRFPWRISARILNLNSDSSQWAYLEGRLAAVFAVGAGSSANFETGEGKYGVNYSGDGSYGYEVFCLGGNAGAVDTSADVDLVLQVIHGSSSGSYETKLYGAVVGVG